MDKATAIRYFNGLARNNLPLILRNSADNITKSDLELVNQLQAGNPYYKRPAK